MIQSKPAEVKENWFKRVGKGFINFWKDEFIGTWKGITKEKISFPLLLLVVCNIVLLLIANIIAAKTIVFGTLSNGIQFSVPSAVLCYCLGSIVISDVLCQIDPSNKWTRRTCHLGFILNLIMVGIFELTIIIPGTTDMSVLGNTWYMLIASCASFFIGDLCNDKIFKRLKEKEGQGNGKLIKRCILSTICGQLLDATIFITLGLQIFPGLLFGFTFTGGSSLADPIGWANTGIMIFMQLAAKVLIELIVSPLVVWICNKMGNIDTGMTIK